ncbi:MAG: hypothetical protein AB7K24_07725 [Gemmataceae bacterium]
MKRALLTLAIMLITGGLLRADLKFAKPVQVAKDDQQTVITIALSERGDVEVAILDSTGKVIRHLAAGVLGGKNAPPLPLKAGLEQQLVWDGKDDDGKPAATGPFQVRVRAGLSVHFARMIGGSPYTGRLATMPYRAPVNGLVTDDKGNLFALMMSSIGSHGNSGMWPWHLRQFDRDGNYVKTLLPYPPSTKPAQAAGFDLAGAAGFTPTLKTSLYPVFAVLGNEIVPRLDKGRVVFVHSEQRQLNFLSLDGSNKLETIPMWDAKAKVNVPRWLDFQTALSPDGRFAYYSNVAGIPYDGKRPEDVDAAWPQGRIYRQDLSKPGSTPETFFDLKLPDWSVDKYWMPSAWDKKSAAAGIDTDAAGNILVCDLVNQQVVEISPAGKQLSATKVAWPDKLLVNRKTGDMYVLSRKVSRGALPPATLFKIKGRGDQAKVLAELKLEGTIGGGFTVDESGERPVLYLGGEASKDGKNSETKLLRVEDQGKKLNVTTDGLLNRDPDAITFVGYMDVDPEAELVYVTRSGGTAWRYDGNTGKGGPLPIKAVDLAIGPQGMIYTWGTDGSYHGPIGRFTRDLKPAPLANGENTYGFLYGRAGRGSAVCGMDVDKEGRVFATFGTNDCHVRAYDAVGNLVDFPRKLKVNEPRSEGKEIPVAITGVVGYGGSLRLDRQGNIYLLQAGFPSDYPVPSGFEKDEGFKHGVGTIYKFPPKGGEIEVKNWAVTGVKGVLASYPGCGPVSRWRADGSCACLKPRFDIDDYGRLYVPNGVTFQVSIRDNADNEIVRFGGYGNFDCQGPDSKEPKPAIPLGWPVTAGASERAVYVGDCLNHRVVRVDKRFALEASVKIGQ